MLKIDLHKIYSTKKRKVIIDCKADYDDFSTVAIYGRSGIGKSTVLRMIAGLENPDDGRIEFNGEVWYSKKEKINLPIAQRKIGFVFQDFNLFPNMTVEGNLKYASKNNQLTPTIISLLKTLDLFELCSMYPDELSGGQRQRISIVRAICQEPQLLLLDEPFSALDDDSIAIFLKELEVIQNRFDTKVIIVSHRKSHLLNMTDLLIHMVD